MRKRGFLFKRVFLILLCVVAALFLWTAAAERKVHYMPEYGRADLTWWLEKKQFSDEDYAILFAQTGLGKVGVDELYQRGEQKCLLYLQERFFAPVEYECCRSNVVCRRERLIKSDRAEEDFMPTVHDGDILVTFNGHLFGWRSGHAGLVVDAEEGLVLEATTLGCNSKLRSLECWREYPGFALLRLKDGTEDLAEEITEYAVQYLCDIPYSLLCFVRDLQGGREGQQVCSATQCAHLIWEAYAPFGYDLNSDGGLVVTPADLYKSDFLEVVQVYGINY